jgi:phospholipid N-methyltransferase
MLPRDANREAVIESMVRVGPVMIVAGLIATITFLSLAGTGIPMVQHFGVFAGCGVLATMIIEMTVIPAVRSMLRPPREREAAQLQITIAVDNKRGASSSMPSDRLRFLWEFLRDPASVGALSPASTHLGDAIGAARAARNGFAHSSVPPTGTERRRTVTRPADRGARGRYRLAQPIHQRDESGAGRRNGDGRHFERFPDLEIRAECATLALAKLSRPVGVVSSIPLLNNPQADDIRKLLTRKYQDGLIKFCIVYTYGWSNPLASVGFREGRREHFVTRSFPPASVWVYR